MGHSMAKVEHILIVGGGIAGLTAAVALRQRGFNPELIERGPRGRLSAPESRFNRTQCACCTRSVSE
jgi:2-polyprenyl-6-methoxyphenol hydroxylase-like FAD-dependent oxidoreductase